MNGVPCSSGGFVAQPREEAPMRIDGTDYQFDRDHLETLIEKGNPLADAARVLLEQADDVNGDADADAEAGRATP